MGRPQRLIRNLYVGNAYENQQCRVMNNDYIAIGPRELSKLLDPAISCRLPFPECEGVAWRPHACRKSRA